MYIYSTKNNIMVSGNNEHNAITQTCVDGAVRYFLIYSLSDLTRVSSVQVQYNILIITTIRYTQFFIQLFTATVGENQSETPTVSSPPTHHFSTRLHEMLHSVLWP